MMKILSTVLVVILVKASAFAPVTSSNGPKALLTLHAEKQSSFSESCNAAMTSAFATLLGWSLAGQVASASLLAVNMEQQQQQQQVTFLPATSINLADKIVEMDFSLPSYSESVKGSDISQSKIGVPRFNPFGDFEPSKIAEQDSSNSKQQPFATAPAVVDDVKPTIDKRAAAAAEKAAAEAKKIEEKAAADIKRAEKEARLKVEREKQRAAAERSKQEESSTPAASSFKAPDFSDLKMPDTSGLKMPDTSSFKAPDMPKFDLSGTSSFKAPAMPKFGMPDTGNFKAPAMPKLEMPDTSSFKAPSMPKFDMPNFELPKNDYIDMDQLPKFDAPKISMPSNLPSFPSFGGSPRSDDVVLDSQDARDGRAKDARQVYLQFDASAKEIEAQAREARNLAKEKQKMANAAKDEACQTRPGGKFICLRNPFNVGY
ncbi:hypothetical protein MPSEU_001008900 [Mayamaea pseudoterrestris]|nr:hypothetical protein MPSEU_001008900 [Mayamaea pseudoterrestris]